MLKAIFNTFAKPSKKVRDAFMSAARSKPGRFIIRNSGWIMGGLAVTGDTILGFAYLAPAIVYFVSDASWAVSSLIKKNKDDVLDRFNQGNPLPKTFKRVAGGAGLSGSFSLIICTALDNAPSLADHHTARVLGLAVSLLPGMLQSSSVLFEDQIHHLISRLDSKTRVAKIFLASAKYPLVTSTIPDLLGMGGVAIHSIFGPHPVKMLSALACWALADAGVMLQDENLLKSIDRSSREPNKTASAKPL